MDSERIPIFIDYSGYIHVAYLYLSQLNICDYCNCNFYKVTLEAAASGVPSIVYCDYGTEEWINSVENGWVVNTVEEINAIVMHLIENLVDLQKVAIGAVKLVAEFNWDIKTKEWEEVVIDI